jgi:protein-L-isoaspartate(D-aspartate) O-methyltransferase
MSVNHPDYAKLLDKRKLPELAEIRNRMVDALTADASLDRKVLELMRQVPRHAFAPAPVWRSSYTETDLAASGVFLASPRVAAKMLSAVASGPVGKILLYGAWAGYEAVILSQIADQIYTIEHNPWLLWSAADAYRELDIRNVHQRAASPYTDWTEGGPFDAILMLGSVPSITNTIWSQTTDDGQVVAPLHSSLGQRIVAVRRARRDQPEHLGSARFPPLPGFFPPIAAPRADSLIEGKARPADLRPPAATDNPPQKPIEGAAIEGGADEGGANEGHMMDPAAIEGQTIGKQQIEGESSGAGRLE